MPNKQQAHATWSGNLKEGHGTFSLPKGHYDGTFTHATRFQNADGTNPEELVAAALASCFSMFLSATISKHNYEVHTIETDAEVVLEALDNGPEITSITLTVKAEVEKIGEDDFFDYVNHSKENCPISKLYKGTEITVKAELVKGED